MHILPKIFPHLCFFEEDFENVFSLQFLPLWFATHCPMMLHKSYLKFPKYFHSQLSYTSLTAFGYKLGYFVIKISLVFGYFHLGLFDNVPPVCLMWSY